MIFNIEHQENLRSLLPIILGADEDMRVEEVCEIMGRTQPWISGLPLKADGYECRFHKKE